MATVAGPGPQPHAVDTHTHEDTHANEANETQGSGTGAPAPEGANPPAAASGSFFSSLSSCCPEQATETDPEDSWGVFSSIQPCVTFVFGALQACWTLVAKTIASLIANFQGAQKSDLEKATDFHAKWTKDIKPSDAEWATDLAALPPELFHSLRDAHTDTLEDQAPTNATEANAAINAAVANPHVLEALNAWIQSNQASTTGN